MPSKKFSLSTATPYVSFALILVIATLAVELVVGEPFASNPGVIVILDCGPSFVDALEMVRFPVAVLEDGIVKSTSVLRITPCFVTGPNNKPLTVKLNVYIIALRV